MPLQIRSHSFDIFELSKSTHKPLKVLFLAAVQDFDLIKKLQLDEDKLERLAEDLQDAYNSNNYHSATHAADMTQMTACIMHKDGLGAALTPLMLFGVLLAAAGHDAAHTGECCCHLACFASY
jgi:cAMP-specific phosphodiesterase 4/high affinity cAMP-specific and IBMX-insensitive 3',5'-cyclic phosphodiesterase 8